MKLKGLPSALVRILKRIILIAGILGLYKSIEIITSESPIYGCEYFNEVTKIQRIQSQDETGQRSVTFSRHKRKRPIVVKEFSIRNDEVSVNVQNGYNRAKRDLEILLNTNHLNLPIPKLLAFCEKKIPTGRKIVYSL